MDSLVKKAENSRFYLWLLNRVLGRMIPFNRAHRFRIVAIGDRYVKTLLPYCRQNLNHIRGLHACALATLAEFTTGFLLITHLDSKKYRLIMQRLEMDYHFQGKMNAYGEFFLHDDWFEQHVRVPLKTSPIVQVVCEIKIHDEQGNHLATGKIHWQIKDWASVRTRISS